MTQTPIESVAASLSRLAITALQIATPPTRVVAIDGARLARNDCQSS
jgi:hypothetical protein